MNSLDILLASLPIALLIAWMTKRNSMAANRALPLAALVLYGILLLYFRIDPILLHAAVVEGMLTAITPVSIVLGAVFLFKTMEHTGAMQTVRDWLNSISTNPVAQLMILGWAFSYLIEGISGFGTPAAIVAPLLIGLGYPALPVVVLCLMMNSVPVSFGAVGMPTWFGLGGLGLTQLQLQEIGFKSAWMHAGAALFIPILALRTVLPWTQIRNNLPFITLVVTSTIAASVTTASISTEFPSIAGGLCGLTVASIAARLGIGLNQQHHRPPIPSVTPPNIIQLLKASFPIWSSVVLLLITRLNSIGLKAWLTNTEPSLRLNMGWLGECFISSSLVVGWRNIFQTDLTWSHPIAYVPSLLPFIIVSCIAFIIFRTPRNSVQAVCKESFARILPPLGAFIGALVFVKLLVTGTDTSAANILGRGLANLAGDAWQLVAVYLGALGAFFSGSATVSNLTFAAIQQATAAETGLNLTTILALQSVGGAMGNMICIHNIVAICSVVGLQIKENLILRQTFLPVLIYGLAAGIISYFL